MLLPRITLKVKVLALILSHFPVPVPLGPNA